ncbi:MAG: peptidase M1, partial [Bacteroidia bacterium]|nr:peptidase M1 [Bacteroidia bacterium]
KILSLNVKQTQNEKYPIYRLPVYVDVYTSSGKTKYPIDIQMAEQTFTFSINEKPLLVNFDSERQLLADIDYPKTEDELIFQLQHAPLW